MANTHYVLFRSVLAGALLFAAGGAFQGLVQAAPRPEAVPVDPLWCPDGAAPIGGAGGCSPSFSTLTELLDWLASEDPAVPGVIWLERTYDSSHETAAGFTLDGRDFRRFDRQALTLRGGWNGSGTTTINHDDPSLFSGDSLYIRNWNAPVTVSDAVFSGTSASGLAISTVGDIQLSNVVAEGSTGGAGNGHGASLSNAESGDVTVEDSGFNDNNGVGLLIGTSGAVSLHNITASGNGRGRVEVGGANISNRSVGPPQPVRITGSNLFNDNYWLGLSVFSDGAIELENVTAERNFSDDSAVGIGVYLSNTDADTPQPITLTGDTHVFRDNSSAGLVLYSHGAISAHNLTAEGNGGWGATLTNSGAGSGDLVVDGDNHFVDNGSSGLGLWSNGTIAAARILAEGNGLDGIFVRTPVDALVLCAAASSNGDYGIDASGVLGALTFNDVLFDGLNVSGDYSYTGTPVLDKGGCVAGGDPAPVPDAPPFDIIDLGAGGLIGLNCGELSGTGAVLSDGLRILLDCPTVGDVAIEVRKVNDLPGRLPKGFKFMAGVDLAFTKDLYPKGTPGLITLSFPAPKNRTHAALAILYWDGGQWIDLQGAQFKDGRLVYGGGYATSNGTFDALVNFTGLFVLARH